MQTAGGVSLHVHEIGPADAPRIVCLHGGPAASLEYLLPAFATLADDYRLILYDQRGGGRSSVGADVEISFAAHLRDLEEVLAETGAKRLLGYSFGGLLATMFAARHPEQLERVAVISSAPAWHGYRAALEAALAEAQKGEWVVGERAALERSGLRELMPEEYRRRRFSLSVAGYFADPRLCYGLTPFKVQARAADAVVGSLGSYDFRGELAKLPAERTLLVHGESDPISVTYAEETARLSGARLERLPACGHVPYLEAPKTFFSILRAFLGEAP
jgi:proline iminopeptidase